MRYRVWQVKIEGNNRVNAVPPDPGTETLSIKLPDVRQSFSEILQQICASEDSGIVSVCLDETLGAAGLCYFVVTEALEDERLKAARVLAHRYRRGGGPPGGSLTPHSRMPNF